MPIYSLAIFCYYLAIRVAAIFGHRKARLFFEVRKGGYIPVKEPFIWIHAASAGEGNQAIPLARALKARLNAPVILTVYSPSGLAFHQGSDHFDAVIPLPIDNAYNARKWVSEQSIICAVFVRNELWRHYLNALNHANIPSFLVNAPDHILHHHRWFYGYYLRRCLSLLNQIYAIHPTSETHSRSSLIHGDTKWEYAQFHIEDSVSDAFKRVIAERITVIAGSVWQEEIDLLKVWWNQTDQTKYALVLAPHEVDEATLSRIEQSFPDIQRYSESGKSSASGAIVLIDRIGILSGLYRYGDVAVVGGGWHKTIHNILEPAAAGIPVLFGPKHRKFPEASELIDLQLAFSFKSQDKLRQQLTVLLNSEDERNRIKTKLHHIMRQANGLSDRLAVDMIRWINPQNEDQ